MANFELAVTKTIAREGGGKLHNVPGDSGGETKYGISKRAYPSLDIAKLDEVMAKQIYKQDYWNKILGDQITSQEVAEEIFDCAVNMGVKPAVKLLQLASGSLAADGVFGSKTLETVNTISPKMLIPVFKLIRIARYAAICNEDKTRSQHKFLLGWINRTLGA